MAELRSTMSRREFLWWWEFHKRNPIDPVSIHQKPAAFIAYITAAHSQGGTKRGMQHFLDALVPRSDDDEAQEWFDSLG
ncbi:hypothetical protein AB4071_01900 [Stenotrophomonas sp. 2MCAF14_2]|uniref:hypothetical protein n=1 Tax=Stenotrophomonas sp. 2MCAF14_2 TaxID=3232983 RepID=UPI003F9E69A0